MSLEITHPEKPTEQDKIDDNDYMLPHTINGVLPDFTGLSGLYIRIPVLVEEKTISSPSSSVTFENLNGDNDKKYLLITDITLTRQSQAYSNLILKPNNDSSNGKSYTVGGVSGSNPNKIEANYIIIGFTDNSQTGIVNSIFNIYPITGKNRTALGKILSQRGTYISSYISSSYYSVTNTNITSFVIASTDGGTFTGTIKLYKFIDILLEDLTPSKAAP